MKYLCLPVGTNPEDYAAYAADNEAHIVIGPLPDMRQYDDDKNPLDGPVFYTPPPATKTPIVVTEATTSKEWANVTPEEKDKLLQTLAERL